MGYTFAVELDTAHPLVIDLECKPYNTQTLLGRLVIDLTSSMSFSLAEVRIHGYVAAKLNYGTPQQAIIHESLVDSKVDIIAANDENGHHSITLEAGQQYLPFQITIPRSGELPPSISHRLDTDKIDWKYEITATMRQDFLFSKTHVVKHDLMMRREIAPIRSEDQLTAVTEVPGKFSCRFTVPSKIHSTQQDLKTSAVVKAKDKAYVIKEVSCALLQSEHVKYVTRRGHLDVENAHVPGAVCASDSSRLASSITRLTNDAAELTFGTKKNPEQLEFNMHLDHHHLIPTESGLSWFEIGHKLQWTVSFMDVSLPPLVTEMPMLVENEPLAPKPAKEGNDGDFVTSIIGHLGIAAPLEMAFGSRPSSRASSRAPSPSPPQQASVLESEAPTATA